MTWGPARRLAPYSLLVIVTALILSQPTISAARASADTEPPTLLSLALSPSSVQVPSDAGPAVVTITSRATDDVSGVAGIFIGAQSPTGATVAGTGQLISGTPLDGVWHTQLTLPDYADPGTWRLYTVQVQDAASRNNHIDLDTHGFPSTFVVESNTAPDTQPAQLASLTIAPRAVDPTDDGEPAVVTLTARATDDVSGVRSIFVGAQSPTGANIAGSGRLISGTTRDGIWQIELPLSPYADPGKWTLSTVQVADEGRNNHINLAALNLPDSFCVSCDTPPAPTTVTARPLDRSAHVTWTAADPIGGIDHFILTTQPGGAQIQVPGGARNAIVTGLTNGISYTFTLRAVSLAGSSPDTTSAPVEVAAPATTPERPARPTVKVKGRTVTVSWADVKDGGTPVTSWTIEGTGLRIRVATADTFTTTFRRVPYGHHRFSVYATNAAGDSPTSPRVRIHVARR